MQKKTSSRLVRTNEKQNKKQIISFIVGIVILLFLLTEFGPMLINIFGNLTYSLRGNQNSTGQITEQQIIGVPTLNNVPTATNSATISFTGVSPDVNGSVEIYNNGNLTDTISVENNTDFSVNGLSLSNGENDITARFLKNGKNGTFTKNYVVQYVRTKPTLSVTFPSNNQTFTRADQSITVAGTTDPANTVTVNSSRAIVNSDGSFSYLVQLNNGDNTITIQATNPAGDTTQQQLKVTYNP